MNRRRDLLRTAIACLLVALVCFALYAIPLLEIWWKAR